MFTLLALVISYLVRIRKTCLRTSARHSTLFHNAEPVLHGRPANHLQLRPGDGGERLRRAAAQLREGQRIGGWIRLVECFEGVHAAVARDIRPGVLRELAQRSTDAFRLSSEAGQTRTTCIDLPETILACI